MPSHHEKQWWQHNQHKIKLKPIETVFTFIFSVPGIRAEFVYVSDTQMFNNHKQEFEKCNLIHFGFYAYYSTNKISLACCWRILLAPDCLHVNKKKWYFSLEFRVRSDFCVKTLVKTLSWMVFSLLWLRLFFQWRCLVLVLPIDSNVYISCIFVFVFIYEYFSINFLSNAWHGIHSTHIFQIFSFFLQFIFWYELLEFFSLSIKIRSIQIIRILCCWNSCDISYRYFFSPSMQPSVSTTLMNRVHKWCNKT